MMGISSASFVSFGNTCRFDGGLNGDCWPATVALDMASTKAAAIAGNLKLMPLSSSGRHEHSAPDARQRSKQKLHRQLHDARIERGRNRAEVRGALYGIRR